MKQNWAASYAQRFLEAGWLFAAVVTPLYFNIFSNRIFEPDKATLLRIVALAMGLAWLVRNMELGSVVSAQPNGSGAPWRAQLRTFWQGTPLTPWVAGLAGVLTLTTITSVNPMASLWGSYHRLQGLLTYLSYLVVFFLVAYYLRRWAQAQRLVSVILATSLPVALYGIGQHLGYDPIPWGTDVTQRVTSSLGNPIFLAAYLIMVVPLTLGRLVSAGTRRPRQWFGVGLYGGLLAIQLVVILFTQSRGPWLGLGAALALGAVLLAWRRGRRPLAWGVGLGTAAAVLFIILLNLSGSPLSSLRGASPYLERLGTILDLESGTNKVRLLIWFGDGVGRGTLGLVTESPVRTVIGHGPESMFVAFNPYYPPTLTNYEARGAIPDRSHNDYLDYVVTSGLLGLAAYLGVVVAFFRAAWGYLWRTPERERQLLALGLMLGVVAHVVETFFGIAVVATRAHFWIFLGMTMGLLAMPTQEPAARRVGSPEATPGSSAQALPLDRLARGDTRVSSRRRGQSRSPSRVFDRDRTLELPSGTFTGVGRLRGLPFVLYLAFTAVFFALTLRPQVAQAAMANPPLVGLATLFWLLLGLLLVAWWLEPFPLGRALPNLPRSPSRVAGGDSGIFDPARAPRRWLYLPLGVAAAYLAYLLIGMVVADIYFKAGQEYDRSGQNQRAFPFYLGTVSWGIPQDIYFSYLGGYYVQTAQRMNPAGSPGGGTAIRINKVDDLFSSAMSQPWLRGREELLAAGRVALDEAQRVNPLNPDNGQNLGRFYTLWGGLAPDSASQGERFGQANAYYEVASRLRPTSSALFAEWGYSLFVGGADSDAEAKLKQALALEPDYAPAWVLLGEMRLAQGRLKEAASLFRKTAQSLAARGQDAVAAWGKTYRVEELLRQAEALEAPPS